MRLAKWAPDLCIVLGIAITAIGAPSAWRTDILGAIDQVANNILLLGGGLALAIFVGWVMTGPIEEASEEIKESGARTQESLKSKQEEASEKMEAFPTEEELIQGWGGQ